MDTILQMIQTLGFPIVVAVAAGYYIKYQNDNYQRDLKEERELHRQESRELSEAINNNTRVMQELLHKLEDT